MFYAYFYLQIKQNFSSPLLILGVNKNKNISITTNLKILKLISKSAIAKKLCSSPSPLLYLPYQLNHFY